MTTHLITHKCGHEVEREINKVRESAIARQVEFYASRDCFDCFKATSANSDREVLAGSGIELAELIGSEKQVSWAESVRLQKLAEFIKFLNPIIESVGEQEILTSEGLDKVYMPLRALAQVTSAKFWIDTRSQEVYFFMGTAPVQNPYQMKVWSSKLEKEISVDAKLRFENGKVFLDLRGFPYMGSVPRTWSAGSARREMRGTKWYEREVI